MERNKKERKSKERKTKERSKERLVVKRSSQATEECSFETHAPVARTSFFPAYHVYMLAAEISFELEGVNIGIAYLNTPDDEEMYVALSSGFSTTTPLFRRLRKSLRSLGQIDRTGYNTSWFIVDEVPEQSSCT